MGSFQPVEGPTDGAADDVLQMLIRTTRRRHVGDTFSKTGEGWVRGIFCEGLYLPTNGRIPFSLSVSVRAKLDTFGRHPRPNMLLLLRLDSSSKDKRGNLKTDERKGKGGYRRKEDKLDKAKKIRRAASGGKRGTILTKERARARTRAEAAAAAATLDLQR